MKTITTTMMILLIISITFAQENYWVADKSSGKLDFYVNVSYTSKGELIEVHKYVTNSLKKDLKFMDNEKNVTEIDMKALEGVMGDNNAAILGSFAYNDTAYIISGIYDNQADGYDRVSILSYYEGNVIMRKQLGKISCDKKASLKVILSPDKSKLLVVPFRNQYRNALSVIKSSCYDNTYYQNNFYVVDGKFEILQNTTLKAPYMKQPGVNNEGIVAGITLSEDQVNQYAFGTIISTAEKGSEFSYFTATPDKVFEDVLQLDNGKVADIKVTWKNNELVFFAPQFTVDVIRKLKIIRLSADHKIIEETSVALTTPLEVGDYALYLNEPMILEDGSVVLLLEKYGEQNHVITRVNSSNLKQSTSTYQSFRFDNLVIMKLDNDFKLVHDEIVVRHIETFYDFGVYAKASLLNSGNTAYIIIPGATTEKKKKYYVDLHTLKSSSKRQPLVMPAGSDCYVIAQNAAVRGNNLIIHGKLDGVSLTGQVDVNNVIPLKTEK